MTQPEREPRDLGAPVTFGTFQSSFAVDYSPRVVSAGDVHPSEVDADPKDLSAQESVDSFSDLVPNLEDLAPVEKGPPQLGEAGSLEDPDSSSPTSPGDDVPPVVTPPLPPVKTPSSRSAGKSS